MSSTTDISTVTSSALPTSATPSESNKRNSAVAAVVGVVVALFCVGAFSVFLIILLVYISRRRSSNHCSFLGKVSQEVVDNGYVNALFILKC